MLRISISKPFFCPAPPPLRRGISLAAAYRAPMTDAGRQGAGLAQALRWGAASAALKYTIPGAAPLIDREEVEALLRQDGQSTSLRR
jgi:hypothetical protein